uniref:PIN domain-containing protein n=1 Tax=candidate division WOR-3 bacterium TaxID=2052148 RepID=A0A7C4XW29_UNCW3
MKLLELYLETSVWNFLFANDAPELRDVTQNFFDEITAKGYHIFISDIVITEIEKTKDRNKRKNLITQLDHYRPILLPSHAEVALFAEKLIANNVVPIRFRDDALHIGYAVVNELDVLVSWNLTHIVKLKTKVKVNALATLEGYKGIIISTPEEVIGYD